MAIRSKTLKYIQDMIKKSGFKYHGLTMCELGNQIIHCRPPFRTSKEYFESKGVKHISIDINGKDGALPLDLSTRISIGQFDVVTNLGTSEHVKNEEMCFNNIDRFCRVGGIMIHVVPAEKNWIHHDCYRRYTTDFFKKLSKEKNYEIVQLSKENKNDGKDHIYCTVRKT